MHAPVVPDTLEAEAGESFWVWSLRPGWDAQQDTVSKRKKKIALVVEYGLEGKCTPDIRSALVAFHRVILKTR